MDYILDKLFVESPLLGRGCCTICPRQRMILPIWRGRHRVTKEKRRPAIGDVTPRTLTRPSGVSFFRHSHSPYWPSLPSSLDPSGPFKHKVMLLACVGNLPPDPEGTYQGPVPDRQEARPCCSICHTRTHVRVHTNTHAHCSCDIVCVSSVLWRVRGQMDKSVVKETTFIWNTIFSVWTEVV